MATQLIHLATGLTDEQAGGHGDRWAVFDRDTSAFITRWLALALEKAEVPSIGTPDKEASQHLVDQGEPAGIGLLYTGLREGTSRTGLMALLHCDPGGPNRKPSTELWSAYPMFGNGVVVEASVEQIYLHPNRLEAWVRLELATGGSVTAFDTLYFQHRALYRKDELYKFMVSALAYRIGHTQFREHVIDDPHEIRRMRSRDAWVKRHGFWSREDAEASLAEWNPSSEEDLKPIRIVMSEVAALLPLGSPESDDASFHGEVVGVAPRAVRSMDVDFWRIDVVVMRIDEDFTLPIYVAEHLFETAWRPEVGQYVEGTLWLQAYLTDQTKA